MLSTAALEQSASACLSLAKSGILQPFTELLDIFIGDSGFPAPDLAAAIVQLGQTLADEPPTVTSSACDCVAAVIRHVKTIGKLAVPVENGADADSQATALSKLDINITEMESAAAQPTSSIWWVVTE